MKRKILPPLLLALWLTIPLPACAVTSLTIKDASCASWLEARARNEQYQTAWLLGYLTGVSVGAEVDILKGVRPEVIESWMDNYCRSNPQKRMTDGTSDLIDALLKAGK
jgi:phosphoserine phosphatase